MAVAMVKISKQDTNWILKPESNYNNNVSRFMSKKVLDISSITPVSSEIELCVVISDHVVLHLIYSNFRLVISIKITKDTIKI
jgi:hypothetical protein